MEPLAFSSEPTTAPRPSGGTGAVMPVVVRASDKPLTLAGVFEAEEGGLLRFAIGLVGRRMIAEELVQETFLRLHQVWGQVENPRAWLYRSLRNLALNHLRDTPQESELSENTETAAGGMHLGGGDPPADVLGRMEAVGTVRMLLAELPDGDRELVRLKYEDNLKYSEISRRTGMSIGNVGYRLHHLLKGLADALRRAGVEDSRG